MSRFCAWARSHAGSLLVSSIASPLVLAVSAVVAHRWAQDFGRYGMMDQVDFVVVWLIYLIMLPLSWMVSKAVPQPDKSGREFEAGTCVILGFMCLGMVAGTWADGIYDMYYPPRYGEPMPLTAMAVASIFLLPGGFFYLLAAADIFGKPQAG